MWPCDHRLVARMLQLRERPSCKVLRIDCYWPPSPAGRCVQAPCTMPGSIQDSASKQRQQSDAYTARRARSYWSIGRRSSDPMQCCWPFAFTANSQSGCLPLMIVSYWSKLCTYQCQCQFQNPGIQEGQYWDANQALHVPLSFEERQWRRVLLHLSLRFKMICLFCWLTLQPYIHKQNTLWVLPCFGRLLQFRRSLCPGTSRWWQTWIDACSDT